MRRLLAALLALAPIAAQADELRYVAPLVSLLLPFNTGTSGGIPSGTAGGILYYNTPTTVQSSGMLTAGQIVVGGGSGGAPTTEAQLTCAQMPALTGDVTTLLGACATTVVNITTGTTVAGTLIDTQIAAPSGPSSGKLIIWADSTNTNILSTKNNGGTVSNTVVPSSAGTNQFATGISAAGAITYAQPAFSNLSGSATCAQLPALTGDVTTSAGSCADTVGNISTGATVAGTLIHTQIAAPSSPAASKLTVWADSTNSNVLSTKNNGGTVSNTVVPSTASTHQFATGISSAGAVNYAQPACADISNAGTICQQGYTASTWTPVFAGSTTPGTPTFALQLGTYEQIGRQVTARFRVAITALGGAAGNMTITGLPVSNNSTANDNGHCYISYYSGITLDTGFVTMSGIIAPGFSTILLQELGSTKIPQSTPVSDFAASSEVDGVCNYHT